MSVSSTRSSPEKGKHGTLDIAVDFVLVVQVLEAEQ